MSAKLFLVRDGARWGFSLNVVRAPSPEEALRLVCGEKSDQLGRISVEELDPEKVGILWTYDESPDSGNYDYGHDDA